MPQTFKGTLDNQWTLNITLGNGDGIINIPSLQPCGQFNLLVTATGDNEVYIAQLGSLPVTIFKKESEGQPTNFYTIPLSMSETIDSSTGTSYVSFLALTEDQDLPVAVTMCIQRQDKEVTVTVC